MTHDPLCRRDRRIRVADCPDCVLIARVRLDVRRRKGHVDATGTRRRLQALVALGWPQGAIANCMGISRQNLNLLLYSSHATVQQRTHERALAAYRALSMQPGPGKHARTVAEKNGWAPPLAWDDDTIDDPAARPVGVRTGSPGTPVEDVCELYQQGVPVPVIAHRFGIKPDSVYVALARGKRRVVQA